MAQVKKFTFGENNWNADAALFKSYIDSLECPIIETELLTEYNLKIVIDETITITSYGYGNPGAHLSIEIGGAEVANITTHGAYGSKTFIICCSEKFVFIKSRSASYGDPIYFAYEKIGDRKLWGYSTTSGANISGVTLNDIDSALQYKHGARLNYACEIDRLDYAADVLFDSSNIKAFEDPNFVATTTVTVDEIVTFDSKNHFAVSPNVLAPLDS